MSSKNQPIRQGSLLPESTTLRRRLLRFILIPLMLSMLITGSISYFTARKETSEIYDKQLVLLAQVLHSLAAQEDNDDDSHKITRYNTILGNSGDSTFFYRLWIEDKLALISPNAEKFNSEFRLPGFSDHKFGGEKWRVFVFEDAKNEIVVEVAGRENLRSDIIQEILLVMFVPLLLVVPVIAILVWFGIVNGLKPISTLSKLIQSRDPHNLTPFTASEIPHSELPDEIRPLVDALNSLMVKTNKVLEVEKKFTDHAAHELRTPLAVIKTQAQVAIRTKDSTEKQQMLDDLVIGVDRANHMVNQLLGLSRVQAQQKKSGLINFSKLVYLAINEVDRPLRERGQSIVSNVEDGVFVTGIEDLLVVLVRNLIDNAMKYSPDGSRINVNLVRNARAVVFQVCNSGEPIPVDQQEAIFEHFYRLPGSRETGCGLGLALVQKISAIHNAKIVLTSPDSTGRTCFSISFPIRGQDS